MRTTCCHCLHKISGRMQCYEGFCYCTGCFPIFASIRLCTHCNKRKSILKRVTPPICQTCRLKLIPCIRCNRLGLSIGRVTQEGPVCKTCSVHYRTQKKCSECLSFKIDVSRRNTPTGKSLLCGSCHNKSLPLCSQCGYRREGFYYNLKKEPICKICTLEKTRHCNICDKEIPAGYGRQCSECTYKKALNKKINNAERQLTVELYAIYSDFSSWLVQRRNLHFTSVNILKYLPYFIKLDKLCKNLGHFPVYEEIIRNLTVYETRKNLLASIYLLENDYITLDAEIKEEVANLDTIYRQLDTFPKGSFFRQCIKKYHQHLNLKLASGTTTIRSIRLALTPAITLLKWSEHYHLDHPTNDLINGFLWHSPGRKAGLVGFINFLNSVYSYELAQPEIQDIIFISPTESRKYLKRKLTNLLRNSRRDAEYKETLLKTSISYFHGISIPQYVWIEYSYLNHKKNHTHALCIARNKYNLPSEIWSIYFR